MSVFSDFSSFFVVVSPPKIPFPHRCFLRTFFNETGHLPDTKTVENISQGISVGQGSFTAKCTGLYTPASKLGYLAPPPPPRTIFHGCQIVHWDPLDAKQRCPKKIWFGLCDIAWFLWQPAANLRRGVYLQNNPYLSCYSS